MVKANMNKMCENDRMDAEDLNTWHDNSSQSSGFSSRADGDGAATFEQSSILGRDTDQTCLVSAV